jgi:hypothetical protein
LDREPWTDTLMATWAEFESRSPELAACGRQILYPFRVPLGYLATVRKDGGPRVHPVCPIVYGSGFYGLIGPSPKQRDLLRDGRCAIHSFPLPDRDDEFYVAGRAAHVEDSALEGSVREAYLATGGGSDGIEMLFEFDLERVMLATYKKRGEPDNGPPVYMKWHASER